MTQYENVERYLMARMRELSRPERTELNRPHAFVTISRQAGAGGHSLAEHLMEIFAEQDDELFSGWQIYDQRLCEIVAEDPNMKTAFESLRAEEYRSPGSDFFRQIIAPTIDQDVLMARVFEVIRAVAATGKGIILGRGGANVTRDLPSGVRVRLVAPAELRYQRLSELHGIDGREAAQRAKRIDQHRARLIQARFKTDIDDPTNYDAVWNTGAASVSEIAETIVTLVHRRAEQPQTP